MSSLVGTGSLVRLILRRDRIILPIWVVVLALVLIGTASSFATLYPTPESRQALAAIVGSNPAFAGLLGPVYDTGIGGLTSWRLGSIMPLLVGVISLLTVIRHTRAEEESGRRELLGSTVVGRHAPLSAVLAVTFGANLAMAVVIAGGLVGLGLSVPGSIALGLSDAAAGCMFATVGAVAAQLAGRAGSARGIGVVVVGVSFLLRLAGDGSGENGRLSWLSWLSPIGWAQRVRPFADERWWLLALLAGATIVLALVAFALSSRRDMGAGILPPRLGPAAGSPGLRSPLALAWRMHSRGLLAWTAGFAVMGLVIGNLAQSMSDILRETPQLQVLLARVGGQTGFIDMFFSAFMGIVGLVASAYAVQAALRLRTEEESQRAELVLSTSVGRLRWAASYLFFAVIGPVVILAAVGIAAGLTYGLSTGDVGRELPRVLVSVMVQLPAVWVLAGIAMALFGLLPRFAGVSWALLVAFLLLGQLGQVLQLSQWIIDLSPFTHVPAVLVSGVSPAPLVWLAGVAMLLAIAGMVGFRHRDLGRA